ncbi:MAG: hypothetical protein NW223_12445 [Hyphomicrobiaceae bacterium]|nr:hypothetical protein [Hyphomicrobiaceae bacterium]
MMRPVGLDDQPRRMLAEVHDEGTKRRLLAEMMAFAIESAQVPPESALGVSFFTAQPSCPLARDNRHDEIHSKGSDMRVRRPWQMMQRRSAPDALLAFNPSERDPYCAPPPACIGRVRVLG